MRRPWLAPTLVSFPLAVIAVSSVVAAGPATSWTHVEADAWQLGLQLPNATQSALRGGDGISGDQLRRNGLVLSARGAGEVSLVMFAVTVEDGRMVDSWTSRPFDAAAGRVAVPSRFLPAVQKARVTQAETGRPMPVDPLVKANRASGSVSMVLKPGDDLGTLLPRPDMTRGAGLVMFVAPADGGSGSTTTPLFLRTADRND